MSSSKTISTSIIATAAVAVTSLVYLKLAQKKSSNCSNDDDTKFQIPTELLKGEYANEMKVAIKLALQAGGNMIEHLETKGTESGSGAESKLGINTKQNDADFCTAIDLLNEEIITNGIQKSFPTHNIIGEEDTGTGDVPKLTDKPTWIIDPVDGTTNFASGSVYTCVSIGLCVGSSPVMGVAYSPKTKEMYLAMKGHGAYRNGERIQSTDAKSKEKTLSNSVVCFEFGYARSDAGVENMVGAVERILKHGCRSTRSYGSGVLDICYVASGRLDVVYTGMAEEGWKPWDYCAAMVVAEEAGCVIRSLKENNGVNDFDAENKVIAGQKFDIYSRSMICGVNATVVEQCRKVVLGL
jgi:fructose-1,6-bisphosphatase/inositol monophosphatase family enzyme